jgi:F-type H+-transporting ATPase subunit epsilon
MSGFSLHLLAVDRSERIDGVLGFVGEDGSGSFGLRAGHERFMTVLVYGLARMRLGDGSWQYLGLPGGLLYFVENECRISTRRYARGADVARITEALTRELLDEERALRETRLKLHRLEAEMLKELTALERE